MHPYARRLGIPEPIIITVLVNGNFVNEVPEGFCIISYEHKEDENAEPDPTHALSFKGHCIFSPTGEGGSLISEGPATFHRGDSYIEEYSFFYNAQPAPNSKFRIYRLDLEQEVVYGDDDEDDEGEEEKEEENEEESQPDD